MTKIRARVTKILDDGTEIDLANIEDYPWFVTPVLKDIVKRIYQPAPPVKLEGQMELEIKT